MDSADTSRLYPMVLMNVSDHFTRSQLQSQECAVGVLLGVSGELTNSFELPVTGRVVDQEYATVKISQCFNISHVDKQVFPDLEVVGWYTAGAEPTMPFTSDIHTQVGNI